MLQKDGKRGTGTQSYTVKNGDAYPDGTTIFILGKADYVILAAVCDEKGVIKGENNLGVRDYERGRILQGADRRRAGFG